MLVSKHLWTPQGMMTELGCVVMINVARAGWVIAWVKFGMTWWNFLKYNLLSLLLDKKKQWETKGLLALTLKSYKTTLICIAWLTLTKNKFAFKNHAFPVSRPCKCWGGLLVSHTHFLFPEWMQVCHSGSLYNCSCLNWSTLLMLFYTLCISLDLNT